ncbi:MAG: NCS2 family permease, partial [Candidatus Binatia bacterium]
FSSMIFAAIGVALIERRFQRAALWSLAACALSMLGVIHAYDLTPAGVVNRFGFLAAPEFAAAYLMLAVLFFAVGLIAKRE